MPTFQKRGDSWRAIVRLKGISDSATFPSKQEAKAWAATRESEINAGARGQVPDKTFGDLLDKYSKEISVNKRGARAEQIRLNKMIEGRPDDIPPVPPDPITRVRLKVLDQTHFTEWKNRRIQQVGAGSLLRERNTLSNACKVALLEWKWLLTHPMKGVQWPEKPDARDRRITQEEIEKILFCAGYSRDVPPCTMTARVGAVVLFAIETAMRAGEICALRWPDVYLDRRFCTITGETIGAGKTKAARRNVALSIEAIRLINQMPRDESNDSVFRMSTQSLDALFRKIRDNAAINDLAFHDTRHEAITRLSKKMDVLALARMVGHRNVSQLMDYYNESAEDLAPRLD
jgi:integrase